MLQQFQISREESQRLRDIEEKLTAIQNERSQELELQVSNSGSHEPHSKAFSTIQFLINTTSNGAREGLVV